MQQIIDFWERTPSTYISSLDIHLYFFTRLMGVNAELLVGQRHVNHPPMDHPYKCHENNNHSHVP